MEEGDGYRVCVPPLSFPRLSTVQCSVSLVHRWCLTILCCLCALGNARQVYIGEFPGAEREREKESVWRPFGEFLKKRFFGVFGFFFFFFVSLRMIDDRYRTYLKLSQTRLRNIL